MNSKLIKSLALAVSLVWTGGAVAADKPVGITPDMMDATVKHGGKSVKIVLTRLLLSKIVT